MAPPDGVAVKVWGDYGCFTRPEAKVERISYPVMTPSAASGVLEAIFWKPEFRWVIREIRVLAPITYLDLTRNEVKDRVSIEQAVRWSQDGWGSFLASSPNVRTQRSTTALRAPAYVIVAGIETPSQDESRRIKFREQALRRIATGRCFTRPYLGCREFAADFAPADGTEVPIAESADLGRMLLRMDYDPDGDGTATPVFWDAVMDQGVIRAPHVGGAR